jgi:hypothetical protein
MDLQIQALLIKQWQLDKASPLKTGGRVLAPGLGVVLAWLLGVLLGQFVVPQRSVLQLSLLNTPGFYQAVQGSAHDCLTYFLVENRQDNLTQPQFEAWLARLEGGWPALRCRGRVEARFRCTKDADLEIQTVVERLNEAPVRAGRVEGLQGLADGVIRRHAPDNFTLMVNDNRLAEYHRNNGLTKLLLEVKSNSFPWLKVSEGLVEMEDLLAKSLMAPRNYFMGSVLAAMPEAGPKTGFEFVVDFVAAMLLALSMSLTLPACL